jgi:hypothetical protein
MATWGHDFEIKRTDEATLLAVIMERWSRR